MEILFIVELIIGLALTFLGMNIFKSLPRVAGFLLGGLLAINIMSWFLIPPAQWTITVPIVTYAIGGIIGGLVVVPLYTLIAALTSGVLGVLIGLLMGNLIAQQGITRMVVEGVLNMNTISPLTTLLMVVFAVAFAGLTMVYEDFMIILSTAYIGAFITTSGLNHILSGILPVFSNSLFLGFFWFTLGLIGLILQNNYQD